MTDRWRVYRRPTTGTWLAVHPRLGVRAYMGSWLAAFGFAYRAAMKEAEREL